MKIKLRRRSKNGQSAQTTQGSSRRRWRVQQGPAWQSSADDQRPRGPERVFLDQRYPEEREDWNSWYYGEREGAA